MTDPKDTPQVNETWRYRNGRGWGEFTVVAVNGDRVTLRPGIRSHRRGDKNLSLRTLRNDYERVTR